MGAPLLPPLLPLLLLLLLPCARVAEALCGVDPYEYSTEILCPTSGTRYCWNVTKEHLVMHMEGRVHGWMALGFFGGARYTGAADVVYLFVDGHGSGARGMALEARMDADLEQGESHSAPVPVEGSQIEVVAFEQTVFSPQRAPPPGYPMGMHTSVTFRWPWAAAGLWAALRDPGAQQVGSLWATRRDVGGRPREQPDGGWAFPTHWPSNYYGSGTLGISGGNKGYNMLRLDRRRFNRSRGGTRGTIDPSFSHRRQFSGRRLGGQSTWEAGGRRGGGVGRPMYG
mmetsp:Transcript_18278/g.59129  ORF Transcript_18278/g.59129 Transcript_18278/m.59129 type:complete len:284 (+) Transcript_18278:2-853(+)